MIKLDEVLEMDKKEITKFLETITTHKGEKWWYIHQEEGLPCLVAHIDRVNEGRKIILKDKTEKYYMSPQGLGADDRAGVYALLKLYEEGIPANFLFTDEEEKGGIGAYYAAEECEKIKETAYFIEIDRRNNLEVVCYNDEEIHAEKLVQTTIDLGFQLKTGSFSDITILGEMLGIAGINLSAGFVNEHSISEILYVPWLQNTINTIPKIIKKLRNKKFRLPEDEIYWYYPSKNKNYWLYDYYNDIWYYEEDFEIQEYYKDEIEKFLQKPDKKKAKINKKKW